MNNGSSPICLDYILNDIVIPDIELAPDVTPSATNPLNKDLFAEHKRLAWKQDQAGEARCNFDYKPRITRRGDTQFISIWQKSLMGRLLTDIKADDTMVDFFASNVAKMITEVLGHTLHDGDWAVVHTPKRRHLTKNFAARIAEQIAILLGIPFHEDIAVCKNKQRLNAVFSINFLPPEHNLIVFDDFVTTGSTIKSMRTLLEEYKRNCVFFVGINNKL